MNHDIFHYKINEDNTISIVGITINAKKLTEISIPDGVTEIGYHAFRGCTSLKSITIPNTSFSPFNSFK